MAFGVAFYENDLKDLPVSSARTFGIFNKIEMYLPQNSRTAIIIFAKKKISE